MSPNNKPITSNLIEDKNPMTTSPTANDEWANKPNRASPGSLVVFCNLNNIIAIIEEITNTEKAILISKKTAIVTPSKAEWDNVSPKKDSLLHIIKQPIGPVTKATPKSANNALIKKSSSIIYLLFSFNSPVWRMSMIMFMFVYWQNCWRSVSK